MPTPMLIKAPIAIIDVLGVFDAFWRRERKGTLVKESHKHAKRRRGNEYLKGYARFAFTIKSAFSEWRYDESFGGNAVIF